MASIPVVLLNGTTADANEVMANFNEIYSNIDQTNIGAPNKTGTGRIVLDTAPTITGGTFSGTFSGTPSFSGRPTFSVGLTVPTTQTITLNAGGTSSLFESSSNTIQINTNSTLALQLDSSNVALGNRALAIQATQRFYLDGGNDTYISELAANVIGFTANNTLYFRISPSNVRVAGIDFLVDAGRNIYLDGGGDTYLTESSANTVQLVTGGSVSLNITNSRLTLSGELVMPALQRIYFDGGGDTYIYESAANVLLAVVGGVNGFLVNRSVGLFSTASNELALPDKSYPSNIDYASRRSFAKAWGRIGATGTIVSSFNLSSVTYGGLGSGTYILNFTTAFSSSNSYAVVATPLAANLNAIPGTPTASSIHIDIENSAGAATDASFYFVVFGT